MNIETSHISVDPITGEVIDPSNADQLIASLERLKQRISFLNGWKVEIEMAIAALAKNEAKTERVAGEERRAKVEWPGTEFDAKGLKELWINFPKFRAEFLRIESVGVQRREYDKLKRMSGTEELEQFKRLLVAMERPSDKRPTITIEA